LYRDINVADGEWLPLAKALMLLENVRNHTPTYMPPHSRRCDTSVLASFKGL
jgi:hypothetical protein